ncbi:hypothetical protein N7523_006270 [Penicillium sp. IBT 18751x]|nr:hypothetical protein N7523_006270 [Penicillium sp. IBT 18751x]
MASESFPTKGASPAPVTAPVGNEQAQPIHSVVNTSHTDTEPVAVEKAKAAAHTGSSEAPREPAGAQPPVADHPLGGVAASEAEGSAETTGAFLTEEKNDAPEQEESKPAPEPRIGEKRDIDSTAAPVTAPVSAHVFGDKDELVMENSNEPDIKKQKIGSEPVEEPAQEPNKDTNGFAPASATDKTNGEPKKAGRPKKEKVKDAVKKVVPGDGIGSRTRSRTKPT